MAKMFYTLEEAAERLTKSEDELRQMAERGELQEFRDGDRLMFKRDQIDLLADDGGVGDAEGTDEILGLADSGELSPMSFSDDSATSSGLDLGDAGQGDDLGLEQSGSMIGLADSAMVDEPISELTGDIGGASQSGIALDASGGFGSGLGEQQDQTGISIFDADDTEDVDPSAQTNVEAGIETPDFVTDSGASGSGSGLLDLTRESDDTSLGADLLEDVYGGSEAEDASDDTIPAGQDSSLFESTPETEGDLDRPDLVPTAVEHYDGVGSALVGGLSLGMIVALVGAMLFVITGEISAGGMTSSGLVGEMVEVMQGFWWAVAALGGVVAVLGIGILFPIMKGND
ncbi:MAG: helix-turn-helix domain-containing protein [Planctomycetota bacterium]